MNSGSREPRQARSRDSEDKLIIAAIATLQAHGFDEATVPRIATAAGLTSGALYRRFSDKGELLRRCVIRVLEEQLYHLQNLLTDEFVRTRTLKKVIVEIVGDTLSSYRDRPKLIEALVHVMKTSTDEPFRERAAALEKAAMGHIVAMLLRKRDEISHPEPETAIRMAFLVLSATLGAVFVRHADRASLKAVAPVNDAVVQREMERIVIAYLGAG